MGHSSDETLPFAPDHALVAFLCPLLHISSLVTPFVPSNTHLRDKTCLPSEGQQLFHTKGRGLKMETWPGQRRQI